MSTTEYYENNSHNEKSESRDRMTNIGSHKTLATTAKETIENLLSSPSTISMTPTEHTDSLDTNDSFHNPIQQEVRKHLHNNVDKIDLDKLRQKDVYTKFNICVDGREDGEGIASFGGFAGIIGATIPVLKEYFSTEEAHNVIRGFLGDSSFYVHSDTHTEDHNHGATYVDCQRIECGAIGHMLMAPEEGPEKYSPAYNYDDSDRAFMWQLIDSNGHVKVLPGDHLENRIISIENTARVDKDTGKDYLNYTKGNTHKETGEQYFIHHVSGRNMIIQFFAEDLATYLLEHIDHKKLMDIVALHSDIHSDDDIHASLSLALKANIIKRSDIHTNATLLLLKSAQKVINEKGEDAVVTLEKISHTGNHIFKI